jgi:hypothetical protein
VLITSGSQQRDAAVLAHDSGNDLSQPVEPAGLGSLFKWETLTEIGPYPLKYKTLLSGKMYQVELVSGVAIRVWRSDDAQTFFCHGLTFGGKNAPGGPASPFSGSDVLAIVQNHYDPVVPDSGAMPGDILVWEALDGDTPHSAILLNPVVEPGTDSLGYGSTLRTKNGVEPETVMSLEELVADYYGESYRVYRRQ